MDQMQNPVFKNERPSTLSCTTRPFANSDSLIYSVLSVKVGG
ncbi:MAG: hypothetical protein SPJ03_03290 [Candidatus Cryptobacteroides sp.]|nr:hypothetical protein [Candidatus Cryptobacteroides sp.]